MPVIMDDSDDERRVGTPSTAKLPFPPVTKSHIMHCSFHSWHPKYRTITPKARVIPLSQPFIDYLRADGIILPSDDDAQDANDSGFYSDAQDDDSDDEDEDVAASWREVHESIRATIAELGGKVYPKLNWSAPKDATWMNANTMECRTPNDIYLLLKSSDFVTFDLEHAFQDCVDSPDSRITTNDIPFHLILRKSVTTYNPSVEFRCFVRERKLLCICQRDLNHYEFLEKMEGKLKSMIKEFFDVRLRDTFDDESFVFDVYIPQPFNRVWLVDVNPWAPRTDPLLFSWMELLDKEAPPEPEEPEEIPEGAFARVYIGRPGIMESHTPASPQESMNTPSESGSEEEELDEEIFLPELRLVRKNDPEAYNFSHTQYSAHKLPKDVVDASQSGEGLREFARDWQNILEQRKAAEEANGDSD
ncbi:related to Cell division cycle protein 123 [Ramularia collo-cygni]|uniref:Related to Cell division cycle protein 123 n=1 Tax=Ramularia collo-cygni TaxID=112498 RepID=A0A2D3UZG8_9PEZI|nr:related to Cell division cycle protein 123 [Ramularia collo-cygni]CZT19835.1 related to Cell division cycle protein 123 [Ramularia collo-cygni]